MIDAGQDAFVKTQKEDETVSKGTGSLIGAFAKMFEPVPHIFIDKILSRMDAIQQAQGIIERTMRLLFMRTCVCVLDFIQDHNIPIEGYCEENEALEQFALYYILSHTDNDPLEETEELSADEQNAIRNAFRQYVSFHLAQNNKNYFKTTAAFIDSELNKLDFEKAKVIRAAFGDYLPKLERHALIKPEHFSIPTDKLNHQIVWMDILERATIDGQLKITQTKAMGNKEPAYVMVGLSFDGVELKTKSKITPFDRVVYSTICTLYQAGNQKMTPREVFRTMNGNTSRKPNETQLQRINESLRKFMGCVLTLDITDEVQKTKLRIDDERIAKGYVETHLLSASRIGMITENGREVVGYKVHDEPILYTYAKAKRHIITVPIGLLDTSDKVSDTEDITVIKDYLLQQIENMKPGGYRDNRNITYCDIYEKTGLMESENREVRRKFRESVKKILESWKERGYIKGYTDTKKGQSVTGIEIHLECRPISGRLP